MSDIIGREKEVQALQLALQSKHAELIVVYGRRRIGKTFLIRETYKKQIQLEWTGIYKVPLQEQLLNFHLRLHPRAKVEEAPTSWIEAFHKLSLEIQTWKGKQKKVIFVDEFPWLDTPKSRFLPAFENFWNGFASKRNDLIVVVCGSAASYMLQKIVKSRGGLHNRLTQRVHLQPFELHEVAVLLQARKVKLSQYDLLQLYMVLGGVPYYLERVPVGASVAQIVDQLCFTREAFLREEFTNIFASLFNRPENHEAIVRALAKVRAGLTRNQIQASTKVPSGGTLSKTLNELAQSGFIQHYQPYRGVKNGLYRLTDEYARFYLRFIEKSKATSWLTLQKQAAFKAWTGFSFETICIKHSRQILHALQIAGIHSEIGNWVSSNSDPGAQIDLLIDRDDHVINLCEIKFTQAPFTITKKYGEEIRNKQVTFQQETKTRKTIFTTFITTYGVKENSHSLQLVQNQVTMESLFEKV